MISMGTVILCSFLCAVNGQDPDAAAIMARVASNMESASEPGANTFTSRR